MNETLYTTERDVALDLIAALDMFDGLFGGDDVTIDEVTQNDGRANSIVVTLSNGDRYSITVAAL